MHHKPNNKKIQEKHGVPNKENLHVREVGLNKYHEFSANYKTIYVKYGIWTEPHIKQSCFTTWRNYKEKHYETQDTSGSIFTTRASVATI